MLVLSRKEMQSIRIGEDVVLTVLEIRGSAVRLGIEAPGDIRIVREELRGDPQKERPAVLVLEPPVLKTAEGLRLCPENALPGTGAVR